MGRWTVMQNWGMRIDLYVWLYGSCNVQNPTDNIHSLYQWHLWYSTRKGEALYISHKTYHFFPRHGQNSLCLPVKGWPGWVGHGPCLNANMAYLWMIIHLSTKHWCHATIILTTKAFGTHNGRWQKKYLFGLAYINSEFVWTQNNDDNVFKLWMRSRLLNAKK